MPIKIADEEKAKKVLRYMAEHEFTLEHILCEIYAQADYLASVSRLSRIITGDQKNLRPDLIAAVLKTQRNLGIKV